MVLVGRTPDPALLERKPMRDRRRPRGSLIIVALLSLALLLQIAHRERAALATAPLIGAPVAQFYAAIGRPIEPSWDVRAYAVRQLGAATDERPGFFTVRASLRNAAPRAQPAPLLRLRLLDLEGRTVAQRDLLPREYASNDALLLAPGRRIEAELSALDPGPRVVGFEVDACLPRADRAPVCSADGIASGARAP